MDWIYSITFLILVLSSGFALISPIVKKSRRRVGQHREDGILIIHDPPDAEFEIVAVPGLGSHPEHTWEGVTLAGDGSRKRVHLLRHLLPNDFEKARIVSFAHNTNWLVDGAAQTADQLGKRLLAYLVEKRQGRRLPITFIGHSFGGIIIKKALCESGDSGDIPINTRGIIFLGTPHQGSSASRWGAAVASLTGFLGSDRTLLLSLQSHSSYLSDLEDSFRGWVLPKSPHIKVISFHESKPTYMFGWLSIGHIVNRNEALGYAGKSDSIDKDHSGMNKFSGHDDPQYIRLKREIDNLGQWDKPYKYICNKYYTNDKLKIVRLSREALPLENCYINLAIVAKLGKDVEHQSSPFSRYSRLEVETLAKGLQIKLKALFNSFEEANGRTIEPRRILIRGRAGVGKTTLCKKIVHDFIYCKLWKGLFDRVLWIPLRILKEEKSRESLGSLFSYIYFTKYDGAILAENLWRAMEDNAYSAKSLLILDGLDEVSELLHSSEESKSRVLKQLLAMPNVIITARPHVILPNEFEKADLELETIGFSPNQVHQYLDRVVKDTVKVEEIQSFLGKHWLLQSLVRIPIQLDALCLIWSDDLDDDMPETMTAVYEAISERLWKKDILRLKNPDEYRLAAASPSEIPTFIEDEIQLVEFLAFTGIRNNIIDFQRRHRKAISELAPPREGIVLDQLLGELSFLRASDSADVPQRSYHFIHLTFQEFFAAWYFKRHWESGENLEYIDFQSDKPKICSIRPVEFLEENRYDIRYDVVWRFTVGLIEPDKIPKFFKQIEEGRLDLLGYRHQQLVMHCMSEVRTPFELQSRPELEKRLSGWLLLEIDFKGFPLLARESDFPDEALRSALNRSSKSQKEAILLSIEEVGRYLSNTAVQVLKETFTDTEPHTRSLAIRALTAQPQLSEHTVEATIQLLIDKDADKDDQEIVIKDLARERQDLGLPERLRKAIIPLIGDAHKYAYDHSELRAIIDEVNEAMEEQSSLSKKTITTLVTLLRSATDTVQYEAIMKLRQHSDLPEEIVSALVELLEDVADNASNFGPNKHSTVQTAVTSVLYHQSNLSHETGITLARLVDNMGLTEAAMKNIIGMLAEHLNTPEKVITEFIRQFREMGRDRVGSRPFIHSFALSKISKEIVRELVKLLEDADWEVRYDAADILSHQEDLSEEANAIEALARSSSAGIQYTAAVALGKRSSLPEQTVRGLVQLLSNDSNARSNAAEPLKNRSLSIQSRRTLIGLLKDDNPGIRTHAAEVLAWQPSLSSETICAILVMFQDMNRSD
ncbi:hypothetical protein M426DRAFT_95973 [Hypoxylon sp. CI-4A]|nr:hypothetical protein M426DRAFT_95973 [Hypoxylon sp. CI-4A]